MLLPVGFEQQVVRLHDAPGQFLAHTQHQRQRQRQHHHRRTVVPPSLLLRAAQDLVTTTSRPLRTSRYGLILLFSSCWRCICGSRGTSLTRPVSCPARAIGRSSLYVVPHSQYMHSVPCSHVLAGYHCPPRHPPSPQHPHSASPRPSTQHPAGLGWTVSRATCLPQSSFPRIWATLVPPPLAARAHISHFAPGTTRRSIASHLCHAPKYLSEDAHSKRTFAISSLLRGLPESARNMTGLLFPFST